MRIIGHQTKWQFLIKSAELGKLPHALLFTGQEKLGKKTLAVRFAKLLLGEDIEKRQHPDFIFVSPIEKEIQIDQIRELIWKLSLKPSLAPLKIAIIDQAHCLNQEAQNCFLKTLEEPKDKSLIILITETPELLLPTIISRSEIIKFYPVPKLEIENYLREKKIFQEKEIELISEISQGKPGVAIDFLNEPKKMKERLKRINELIKLTQSSLLSRFKYAEEISKNNNSKEILNIWLYYFRENLFSKMKQGVRQLASDIDRLREIQKINFLISTTNINPRLALEILMLKL